MIAQRFVIILVTLSLIVVAAFTIRTAVATSEVVSSGKDLSDYALRHPNAVIPISTPDPSDYALRHHDEILAQDTQVDSTANWHNTDIIAARRRLDAAASDAWGDSLVGLLKRRVALIQESAAPK